jgi:hypothetical protein
LSIYSKVSARSRWRHIRAGKLEIAVWIATPIATSAGGMKLGMTVIHSSFRAAMRSKWKLQAGFRLLISVLIGR